VGERYIYILIHNIIIIMSFRKSSSIDDAFKTRHIPTLFSALLDSAESSSEFNLLENEKYFLETLLNDSAFVEALKKAHERGIKTKVILSPSSPHSHYHYNSQEQILFNELCGSYAYGGLNNVKKYLMLRGTKDNEPLSERKAYNYAKSFEKEVLGKRRYLIRAKGVLYRFLGKYKTFSV